MAEWTVELPENLRPFVEQEAVQQGHESPGAYLAHLVTKAQRRAERRRRVEQLLLEGLNSGEPVVADEAFWEELRRDIEDRIRRQDPP